MEGLTTSSAKITVPYQALQSKTSTAKDNVVNAAQTKKMEKIEEAAKDFEAMFMTEMLRPMFEQIKVDENFGGGKGEEVFRGMMLEQYGKQIADKGGIGIAAQVKAAMIRMQEEAK